MRITLNWLKDFLKTEATAQNIAAAFNRIGHEVEAVETTGHSYRNVVVGYVIETKKHPNADKLNVCQVEVAAGDVRQIVCGAANVRGGIKVAVALDGAVLPGDFTISKSKIRGELSNGMICSLRELALGSDHQGIWEMETPAPVGTPLVDVLPQADTVFELGITPNRGDALSILGLARDLAAAGVGTYHENWLEGFSDRATSAHSAPAFTPEIVTKGCSFFAGLSVRGLNNTVQTPDYIAQRLEAAGLRLINPAVDVSQYVMLTLGQPLHFYDAAKINGTLRVAEATEGQPFTALDERTYTLREGDLIIADGSGPLGLAGIIGGTSTGCEPHTTDVFIEAALFERDRIAQTGQVLQINSDARYRFERGVDPSKTLQAAVIAAYLLQSICGGEVSHVVKVGSQMPKQKYITFNPELVRTFGGLDLPAAESQAILQNLGFTVALAAGGVLEVGVPPHLTMHETPEDLVEDVLRIKGYDAVPAVLPALNLSPITTAAPEGKIQSFARQHFAGRGYFEANTYSFISKKAATLFGGGDASLKLTNPIDAAGMSDMRPSLLPGLLDAAERNHSRGEQHIHLAEVGTTFHPEKDAARSLTHTERQKVAAVRVGPNHPKHPFYTPKVADVFDMKADAFSFLAALGHDVSRVLVQPQAPEWFHPGRSGALMVQGRVIGHFGELHPQTLKALRFKQKAAAFELDLSLLNTLTAKKEAFAMSAYQPVRRDFAFVLNATTPAEKLLTTVRKAGKALVRDCAIFDVYEGQGLPEGKKSLAVRLTLQADDHTLSEEELTQTAAAIVKAAEKLGAEIRS